MPAHQTSFGAKAGRCLVVGCVIAALIWAFRDVDAAALAAVFASADWRWSVALLPFALVHAVDALGLGALLKLLGQRVSFAGLLYAGVLSEAVTHVLPLGAAVGETLRPTLLIRAAGTSAGAAVTAALGRKFLLIATEGLAICAVLLAGRAALPRLSPPALGQHGLLFGLCGAAFFLLLLSAVLAAAFGRGRWLTRAWLLLRRVTPKRLRTALRDQHRHFRDAREKARAMCSVSLQAWLFPAAAYLLLWGFEGLETYVLLQLVGADVALSTALTLELIVGFVRALAFVAPNGLGVQDAGYIWLLSASGQVDNASVGAAFAVLKRCRELVWCSIAGLWFWFTRRSPSLSPTVVLDGA